MTISKLQDMNNTQVSTNKIEISCKKKDREGNFWYQKKLWKKVEKKKDMVLKKDRSKRYQISVAKTSHFHMDVLTESGAYNVTSLYL